MRLESKFNDSAVFLELAGQVSAKIQVIKDTPIFYDNRAGYATKAIETQTSHYSDHLDFYRWGAGRRLVAIKSASKRNHQGD